MTMQYILMHSKDHIEQLAANKCKCMNSGELRKILVLNYVRNFKIGHFAQDFWEIFFIC